MSNIIERIRSVDWKKWLNLRPEQEAAIESAMKVAESSCAIADALEKDFSHMEEGHYALATPKDVIRQLYPEPLHLVHPLLVLLGRLGTLIELYAAHDIPDQVLTDTLSDVRIWMEVCEKRTGHPGMMEVGWLMNHFRFQLFRIGRLQFIATKYSAGRAAVYRHKGSGIVLALCEDGQTFRPNGDASDVNGQSAADAWTATLRRENDRIIGYPIHPCGLARPDQVTLDAAEWEEAVRPGDTVLDMHIAEGCPLSPEAVAQSLKDAPEFFRRHFGMTDIRAMTCSSWLLDDNIAQMQPHGNIAAFQRHFYLTPSARANDRQTRERAFGNPEADILTFDCRTSLQKAIKAWYQAGKYCRGSHGIIVL